jgi:hypothetical protein
MRGRFRECGMSHNDQVKLVAEMDQANFLADFNLGHPSEEIRHTEGLDEWISWQKPELI